MRTVPLKQALERGIELQKAGQSEAAEKVFRQLISQYPTNPDVLNLLGSVLLKRKRQREAADLFKMATALRPDIAEFHQNLAGALYQMRQWNDAEAPARRAIELKPEMSSLWSLLGAILSGQRRRDEACEMYQHALALNPDDADAHTSLGVYHFDRGEYEQAIERHRAAIRAKADIPIAHLNLALVLLLTGQEEEGWEEYEWRSQCDGLPKHNFRQPLWDGSPLDGKRILLYTEQGLGDAIQFVRFAPIVSDRGGDVSLICQKELKALLSTIDPRVKVIGRDERLPEFDLYAPLLSLPRILKIRSQNIPATVPYLKPDPKLSAMWQQRLSRDRPGLRVGLAWAGSPSHRRDRERSMLISTLAPLLDMPRVTFYSLQKGAASQQLNTLPPHYRPIDYTADLKTMADTAALIENLDLLITVDTSVCHLAGALAKPVWVMITAIPHWGWGLNSETTPWYPTMRLFRQDKADEWEPVIERVKVALRHKRSNDVSS